MSWIDDWWKDYQKTIQPEIPRDRYMGMMTEPERMEWEKQKSYGEQLRESMEKYWSSGNVLQREKQREESRASARAEELEGWGDYYKRIGKSGPMYDYFKSPSRFEELRRIWEIESPKKKWSTWLQQQNLKEQFYSRSPYERGERQQYFSPLLRRIHF